MAENRPTAADIFGGVIENARDELGRPTQALALSGFAAGLGMGLTGLGVAAARAVLGQGEAVEFVSLLLYPLGFIAVIVGRQQLFTENTLYPVALALDERGHWLNTARLWAIVFAANIVGTGVFAVLAVRTGALSDPIRDELVAFGIEVWRGPFVNTFFSAIIGGWLIALVAWLITAARTTTGQVLMIWSLTFLVGLAGLDHCIATAAEILSAVAAGELGLDDWAIWLAAATVGNVVGGIGIVTILNYGQVVAGRGPEAEG